MGGFHIRLRFLVPGGAIVLASLLFATDAIFREKALAALDPRAVSVLEHGIAFLVLLPWVFFKRKTEFRKIERKDILIFLVLGLGGSALGSTLFTVGVEKIGGATATLFVMLEPLFVLAFAWIFLKERFSSFFVPCAIWVVANMVLLSFSQSSTEMGGIFGVYDENPEALNGMACAFLATLLWGGSTVAGKAAVMRYPNSVVLFWRWAIAFVFLSGVVVVRQVPMPWERIFTSEIFLPLLYLGVIAQTTAYWIYYQGLRQLPASLVTFIELLYPVVGIFLPIVAKGQGITPLQGFASVTLVIAMSLLLGVEYPKAMARRKNSSSAL